MGTVLKGVVMYIWSHNRKAKHEYIVASTIECGIELRGNEVKSIRSRHVSIGEAYAKVENGELILHNMHIKKWETANTFDVDEKRDRRLLVHKSEIRRLKELTREAGMTLIPINIHSGDRGKMKIELGVCRGRNAFDQRQLLKERQIRRDMERGE